MSAPVVHHAAPPSCGSQLCADCGATLLAGEEATLVGFGRVFWPTGAYVLIEPGHQEIATAAEVQAFGCCRLGTVS